MKWLKNGLRKDVGSWNWRGWISFGTFMADQVGNYSLPLIITRIHQKRLKRRQLEFWTNLRQWSWVTKKSWKSPKKVKSLPLCTSQGISAPSPAWRALSPGLVGLQLIFVGPGAFWICTEKRWKHHYTLPEQGNGTKPGSILPQLGSTFSCCGKTIGTFAVAPYLVFGGIRMHSHLAPEKRNASSVICHSHLGASCSMGCISETVSSATALNPR